MKKFTKLLGIVLIIALVMSMGIMAFADESSQHVITIDNTDQNVTHKYEAYQVFVGKLDDTQAKLADIQWGSGVDGDALLAALQASTVDTALKATEDITVAPAQGTEGDAGYVPAKVIAAGDSLFKFCTSAADVANVISKFSGTSGLNESAGQLDAFASVVAANLSSTKADFSEITDGSYEATVTGDGYYFVKDVTTTLTGEDGSDTLSKYLLSVVKNTTVFAKDQGLNPEKKIVAGSEKVAADSAAVGDEVTFEVKIPVPNTKKYIDHFIFDMKDQLPAGMTFTGITSITVGGKAITDATLETTKPYAATTYDGTDGYYTLKINNAGPSTTTDGSDYAWNAEDYDAVTETGGQAITVVFNEFKKFVEKNTLTGDVVVTYTAVVNKNANFTSTGNENEVYFDFSNNPNHDYNGDEPTGDDVVGQTPHDKTKTLLINIEINKTDGSAALAGAEFEITSEDYTVTLVTGEKFVTGEYTAKTGETVQDGTYYKLKDGSYTTTAPTDLTTTSYDSTTTTYKKVTFEKSVTKPGTTKKVTVISDENGKIKLEGLDAGTYTIKETKAPTGFNLDETEHVIKIDWKATTKAFAIDPSASDPNASFTDSTATASITIVNQSGATLPSTGGIGTTIFYVVGSILVVAAGVLLITKKRMSREG